MSFFKTSDAWNQKTRGYHWVTHQWNCFQCHFIPNKPHHHLVILVFTLHNPQMDWHMKSFHVETSKQETEETFNPISVLEENHDVHAHLETSIKMDMCTTLSTRGALMVLYEVLRVWNFVCDGEKFHTSYQIRRWIFCVKLFRSRSLLNTKIVQGCVWKKKH